MGTKLVLSNVAITDVNAPVMFDVDPLESSGSLLLIEPGNPAGALTGVPSNNGSIPNLLADQSASILGASDPSTLVATLVTGSSWTPSQGKLERTSKGGLHIIKSQAAASTDVGAYAYVKMAKPIRDYMVANPSHSYFTSFWARQTRLFSAGGSNLYRQVFDGGGFLGIYNRATPSSAYLYPVDANKIGEHVDNAGNQALGPYYSNGARVFTPAPLATSTKPFVLFTVGDYNTTAAIGMHDGSFVFYRAYVEDLTVSGRTYAQVDALDFSLYQKHVVNAGGRYYGDTLATQPSALP